MRATSKSTNHEVRFASTPHVTTVTMINGALSSVLPLSKSKSLKLPWHLGSNLTCNSHDERLKCKKQRETQRVDYWLHKHRRDVRMSDVNEEEK